MCEDECKEWSHDVPKNNKCPKYLPKDGVVGTKFKSNNYGTCEIVKYISSEKVLVKFCKRRKKYVSQIMLDKRKKGLGYFSTPEEAFLVYKDAK